MSAPRTWKIRDQLPDGKWGPEYEVTLAEYRAKIENAKAHAETIFKAGAAQVIVRRP